MKTRQRSTGCGCVQNLAAHWQKTLWLGVFTIGLTGCSEMWPRLDVQQVGTADQSVSWYVAKPPLGLKLHYSYSESKSPSDSKSASVYFRTAYDSVKTDAEKKVVRNSIIFELMAIVDEDYFQYEKSVRSDRAYKDIIVGITSIALTATATGMGGGAAKTLSGIDTGIKGSNALVDKVAFGDEAPNILLNQMRTVRDGVAEKIYKAMEASVSDYPLDEAIRDVARYYQAGSVTSALVSLAATTAVTSQEKSKAAADAKEVLNKEGRSFKNQVA